MDRSQIERRLDSLPTRPGVYIFRDAAGRILYVGKAVNLRNRVRSYFRESAPSRKVERMVREIADFELTVVDSELEALILECSLIKTHRPHYNVKLRDDKQYPLIRVTTGEAWPRADVVRHRRDDDHQYFGPWTDSSSVRAMLALLNKLFPFRTCPREITGHDPRPCLQFHIKRCLGPCIAATTHDEYMKMINRMCKFLAGRYEQVVDELREKMDEAAENLVFERAAYYRDQIRTIEKIMERQRVFGANSLDADMVAFARDNGHTCVQIFFVRGGRMVERASFPLVNTQDESPETIIAAFLKQFYEQAAQVPPEILIPNPLDESSVIEEWLHRTRGTTVTIRIPRDVDETERLKLVEENASEALTQMKAKWLADDAKTSAALGDDTLEKTLGPRHRQERRHAHSARGLAEDGDVSDITTESGDVVPHPLQRGDLVEQAEVGDPVVEEQEAVDAQPVVDADQHDAVACKGRAVVAWNGAGAVGEGAAVDPDHHGQSGRRRVGRPDVEVEALLARDRGLWEDGVEGRKVRRLRNRWAELERVSGSLPGGRRLRRPEAVGPERSGGIGKALE